jgi:hypothetical protein
LLALSSVFRFCVFMLIVFCICSCAGFITGTFAIKPAH